ncbi:hypothetical protein [Promicromonospora sp. NPDC023987]|uniref:hypothetical protein n=1 Tax=Promicromonospora sp. NPDC023987 TaxID=3155360 RepID=UPI00340CB392
MTGKVTSVRARYSGPDTEKHTRSFGDKLAAEAWLNDERIRYESAPGSHILPELVDIPLKNLT